MKTSATAAAALAAIMLLCLSQLPSASAVEYNELGNGLVRPVGFRRNVVSRTDDISSAECETLCTNEDRCAGYFFTTNGQGTRICRLLSTISAMDVDEGPFQSIISEKVEVTTISTSTSSSTSESIGFNYIIKFGPFEPVNAVIDVPPVAVDLAGCETACVFAANCNVFYFYDPDDTDDPTGECFLLQHIGPIVPSVHFSGSIAFKDSEPLPFSSTSSSSTSTTTTTSTSPTTSTSSTSTTTTSSTTPNCFPLIDSGLVRFEGDADVSMEGDFNWCTYVCTHDMACESFHVFINRNRVSICRIYYGQPSVISSKRNGAVYSIDRMCLTR